VSAPVVPGSGGLAEALNILLDKGLVIDAMIRVSVLGIEILTIEAKIVIASVDTYIRYLEAMHRLDMARRAANGVVLTPGPQGIAGTYGLLPVAMGVPIPVPPIALPPALPAPAVQASKRAP
jgi:gas vesicle structural protein